MIYDIIESTSGLPIGNYTSQYFGNIYLYNLEFGNLLERTYPIMNVDITTENEIMYIIKAKLILIYRLYKVLIKLI